MNVDARRQPARDAVTGLDVSASQTVSEVDWCDLPLSCPPPSASLWNGHPRIYLPIHKTGREHCPYCGTLYVLKDVDIHAPMPRLANIEIERCYMTALEHWLHLLASQEQHSQQQGPQ